MKLKKKNGCKMEYINYLPRCAKQYGLEEPIGPFFRQLVGSECDSVSKVDKFVNEMYKDEIIDKVTREFSIIYTQYKAIYFSIINQFEKDTNGGKNGTEIFFWERVYEENGVDAKFAERVAYDACHHLSDGVMSVFSVQVKHLLGHNVKLIVEEMEEIPFSVEQFFK